MYSAILVDDYEIFRKQLVRQKWFENQQIVDIVAQADDGIDALSYLRKRPVDILLTDIKMPRMDGLELIRIVKEENLCQCTILLSEYADFEYAREGMRLGALDYIVKPVKESELQLVMAKAAAYLENVAEDDFGERERSAILNCLERQGEELMQLSEALVASCFAEAGNDLVRGKLNLISEIKAIYYELTKKNNWLSLILTDWEIIAEKILQLDEELLVLAQAQDYLREMNSLLCTYYPVRMSELSRNAINHILVNVSDKLTLSDTAALCYVTGTYLSHSFKADIGKSFVDYIVAFRMDMVQKLLRETDLTLQEIAERVGYDDYKYMSRVFRNIYGCTPTNYRNMRS